MISRLDENFGVSIFHSLNDAEIADRWDRILPQDCELRSPYLLAIESSRPRDLEFHYVFVKQFDPRTGATLEGVLYFQEILVRPYHVRIPGRALLNALLHSFFVFKKFRMLVLGSLFSVGRSGYYFSSLQVSPAYILEIVRRVAETVRPTVCVLKDMGVKEREYLNLSDDFQSFDSDTTMVLALKQNWKSFADYTSDLRKKYRQRLATILNDGQPIVRVPMSLGEIELASERIRELFLAVAQRQSVRLGFVDEQYILSMKKQLGEKFRVVGYYYNDVLLAFATYLAHNNELEVHYIGIDYTFNEKYKLYFNILFDSVKLGIEEGFEQVELGRTSREAKSSMGCLPFTITDYYRTYSSMTKWLLRLIRRHFNSSNRPATEIRRPFRLPN